MLGIFSNDACVAQDYASRTLIGAGKQQGGVYYYKEGSLGRNQVNAVNSFNLWHKRLGHPSSEMLSYLASSLGVFDKGKHDMCEIFFRAKQTRGKFALSENKAKCVFELIHYEPYRVPSSSGALYFFTILDDASQATWVYLMCERGKTSQLLKNVVVMTKTQFGKNI